MAKKKKSNYTIKRVNKSDQELINGIQQAFIDDPDTPVILTKENGRIIVSEFTAQREESYYSGPLPSPEVLKKYDELLPGTAENFINDYRKVLNQNMKHSEKIVNTEVSSKKIGSWTSALFVIGALGIAGFLAFTGQPISASITAITSLGGLYFAYLKKDDNK